MTEQRSVPRQRTFLKGLLLFNSGNSSEDCLVRNLTEGGALVELPHPRAPDAFELLIPVRGLRRRVRAVWRNGGHIGLAFAGEATPISPKRAPARVDDSSY